MSDPATDADARCPLCAGEAQFWCRAPDRHYGIPGEWDVYECGSCGHRFQWPIPTEEQLTGHYPDSYYAFQPPTTDFEPRGLRRRGVWLRMHYLKAERGYESLPVRGSRTLARVARLLRRYPLDFGSPVFRPDGTLLDYGSGAGEAVAFARYTGWKAEGIEMSTQAAAAGRQAGLPIHEGTVRVLEAQRCRYDHIMSSHCVEHVPDVRRLFAAFFAALKPGGTVAVDVPNGGSEAVDRFKDLYFHLTMPLHVHLFSAQSLRHLAEETGFTDVQLASYSLLRWHMRSQLLSPPLRRDDNGQGVFETESRPRRATAAVLALPSFLRSRRDLRGDCLVLSAVKPPQRPD